MHDSTADVAYLVKSRGGLGILIFQSRLHNGTSYARDKAPVVGPAVGSGWVWSKRPNVAAMGSPV